MTLQKTTDAAVGKWRDILLRLGIPEQFLRDKHGPCPICGGTNRFRYDDKSEGKYFCNHCGAGTGIQLLQRFHGWDFPRAAREVDGVLGVCEYTKLETKPDPREYLRKIQRAIVADRKPIEDYLKSRGLSIPPPSCLKYIPQLGYSHENIIGRYPCMVALVQGPDGKPQTWHRTYLADLPQRKKLAPPIDTVRGGAIRLFPADKHLGVGEGIETCLAVTQRTGIPTWPTVSAGGLESFIPPEDVEMISIWGDNDRSFRGQKAAYVLAERLARKIKVIVKIPPGPSDWLDVLVDSS